MTKLRIKAVLAAVLMNLFIIFYSISQIGIVRSVVILVPIVLLGGALFPYFKRNLATMKNISKGGSVAGIVIGIILARLLHRVSPALEVTLGLLIGMLFLILVLLLNEEDLAEF